MPDRPLDNRRTPYLETFDTGSGGWFAWRPARHMPSPLEECAIPPEIESGVLISRSPWWVDSNHAPPGAGYLHLLAFLLTSPYDAAEPIADLHATRPHLDYELRWDCPSSGNIELDTIRIDYPPVPTA